MYFFHERCQAFNDILFLMPANIDQPATKSFLISNVYIKGKIQNKTLSIFTRNVLVKKNQQVDFFPNKSEFANLKVPQNTVF